jgi:hypothetical protein
VPSGIGAGELILRCAPPNLLTQSRLKVGGALSVIRSYLGNDCYGFSSQAIIIGFTGEQTSGRWLSCLLHVVIVDFRFPDHRPTHDFDGELGS